MRVCGRCGGAPLGPRERRQPAMVAAPAGPLAASGNLPGSAMAVPAWRRIQFVLVQRGM